MPGSLVSHDPVYDDQSQEKRWRGTFTRAKVFWAGTLKGAFHDVVKGEKGIPGHFRPAASMATLKPAKSGVEERTARISDPFTYLEASGYLPDDVAILQKPGALREGTILHVPLNVPMTPFWENVLLLSPPMTGSSVCSHVTEPSNVTSLTSVAGNAASVAAVTASEARRRTPMAIGAEIFLESSTKVSS